MLKLVFPDTSHKTEYLSMRKEWEDFEIPSSPGALFRGESFEEFLIAAQEDVSSNKYGVPATLFFLINNENRILGAIQIRHHINHPNLMEYGGHIGYGIRPSERGKGYATEMLKLALLESRKLGLQKVLLGCYDDNIASQKTIEKNGGVFERYTEYEGKKGRRYWIDLYPIERKLLESLEIELLQGETRRNTKRINELLADDFFECGKMGMMFGKKECLVALPNEDLKKTLEYSDMVVHMLSENLGQVRFLCTIQNPGESPTISYRSSLWRKGDTGWQMFFHQGTMIQTKN